jgi:hypothetical protein
MAGPVALEPLEKMVVEEVQKPNNLKVMVKDARERQERGD